MIKCPKCKRQKDLIIEQPTWKSGRGINTVIIDCFCIECKINFTVDAKLRDVSKARDIEEDKEYSY